MSDPNEWRESWLDRAGGSTGRVEPPRLLRLIDEGTRLRRRLDEVADNPARPDHPDVDDVLERLEDALADGLAEPGSAAALAAPLARRLRADHAYLTGLLTRPGLDEYRRAALLDAFRRDLVWLSELVALVEGGTPTHPAVTARLELDRLGRTIRSADGPALAERREAAVREAGKLRLGLLDGLIGQLIAQEVPAGATPADLWSRRFQLSRMQAEVEAIDADDAGGPRRHLEALAGRRGWLADEAGRRLSVLPSERRSDAWDGLLYLARGESNDTVSALEELPARHGARLLERSIEDMRRLHDDAEAARAAAAAEGRDLILVGHLRRLRRRFGRMAQIARNEWQEKHLDLRLRTLFGPRFPRVLDGLILVLILLLTVLIVAETALSHSGRLTGRVEAAFAWADLVICAVFLFEFFLKLALCSGKLLYIQRHALIDFLPSIPFGFLAYVLSGPARAGDLALIRVLRLPRLVRYVRLLRPVIRIARLFIFFFRFTDRLVRRYADVFNRNIILFELKDGDAEEQGRCRHLLFLMRRHYDRRAPEHFRDLGPDRRLALAERSLEELRRRVAEIPEVEWSERAEAADRDIPVEEVVDRLIEMTPEELTEQMGPAFVTSVDRYLRLFDAPFVRRMPVVRQVLEHREKGPAEAAALAANYLGYLMQRALDVVYYVADLQATVSPPLFLDKLGRTIVNATRRPAFRLLTFGIAFAALYGLAYLLIPTAGEVAVVEVGAGAPELTRSIGVMHRIGLFLRGALGWFADKLGLPVIVLGAVCFVLMQLGSWFRRIANQAAEFCERVVEAQFAAQTKRLKVERRDRDLKFLAERVTVPEVRLRTSDDVDDAATGTVAAAPAAEDEAPDGHVVVEGEDYGLGLDVRLKSSETAFLHTLNLLYNDYLDGSPFHRNDTKASTQLLGSLALRNLSLSSLPYFLRGRRRLDRLDMNRAAASLFGGPYLWFDYITRMIVQETAKLLIDYNRHAVPLERLACSPAEVRESYRRWLATRAHLAPDQIELPAPVGRLGGAPEADAAPERPEAAEFFETVDFTAVDFLIADPRRDEVIRRRYGDAVAALVRRDREQNLRRAFRSLPLHRAPLAQRTINVYHLYESFLGKGRLIVLPLRMLWWALRGVAVLVGRVVGVIREILHPTVEDAPDEPEDSYPAAVRKIHRMRKPAFMESLWLRGRFDVEYLGLALPTVPISVGSDSLMETDLDFIGASRHERVMADHFREEQRRRLGRLATWLDAFGWGFEGLPGVLARDFPHLVDRRGEVIRALTVAWVADHDDVETLAASIEALRAIAAHAAEPSSDLRRLPEGLPETVDPGEPLWHRLGSVRGSWSAFLASPIFPEYNAEARKRIVRCLRRHRRSVRGWIAVLRSQGGADPVATLEARLREVMLRTDLWSDQVLTLRTIQTLTMLDVQHYTELVWTLGGYDRLDHPTLNRELPFAHAEEDEEALIA